MSIENCSAEFVFDTFAMSFSSSSTLALEAALSSLVANRQKKRQGKSGCKTENMGHLISSASPSLRAMAAASPVRPVILRTPLDTPSSWTIAKYLFDAIFNTHKLYIS